MHHSDNDNNGIRFLSVCSGIEAASVAWSPLGWQAVAFGEIDKAASAVLAYHYPDVPNLGDFTKIDTATLGRVDILCGGTPCQAFSVAGARRGLDDERGNLSLEFVRLAHELADSNGLRNAVWENVPGVLTMSDNAFGCFLAGIVGADGPFVPVERKPAEGRSTRWWRWSEKEKVHAVCWPSYGMVSGPKGRAAWAVKDAQYFSLAQRRERVLVVADFGSGADPAAVLFERVSVPWNPPARAEAREGTAHATAPSLTASGRGVERTGESRGQDPVVAMIPAADVVGCLAADMGGGNQFAASGQFVGYSPVAYGGNRTSGPIDIATALNAHGGPHGRQDFESETFVLDPVCVTVPVTHTLTTEGADASEDGTGRGTPIIAFTSINNGGDATEDQAPTLTCGGGGGHGVGMAIAFSNRGNETGDIGETLRAASHGALPMVAQAFQSSQSGVRVDDVHATLDSNNGSRRHNGALLGSAVRRLTPRECERLQGFPDDYTRIPVRKYATKKVTKNRPDDMWEPAQDGGWWLMAADGPRYKQLGNSWAVPKFRWLGERIQRLMPKGAANDNQEVRRAA